MGRPVLSKPHCELQEVGSRLASRQLQLYSLVARRSKAYCRCKANEKAAVTADSAATAVMAALITCYFLVQVVLVAVHTSACLIAWLPEDALALIAFNFCSLFYSH